MAEIIKSKEKFHQNPATVKQTKPESGLSKQLLCNLQVENSCDRKQLETEVKNRVAYKKYVSGKFSEMGGGTEKVGTESCIFILLNVYIYNHVRNILRLFHG